MPGDMFPSDEELGKRDDDPRIGSRRWTAAKPSHVPALSRRLLKKRRYAVAGVVFLVLWILYYFRPPNLMEPSIPSRLQPPAVPNFHRNRPPGPIPNNGQIRPPWDGQPAGREKSEPLAKDKSPAPGPNHEKNREPSHDYSGPLEFYELPRSLQSMSRLYGYQHSRRNVLFVASSLKSLSALLPLACEMGNRQRASAHIAIVGRNDLPIATIMEVNGINSTECRVNWLDARPNYAAYSTDTRAEASVVAVLTRICPIIRPQVIIRDHSYSEDAFFIHAIDKKSAEYGVPVIELPAGQSNRLGWIAMMDATALSAWHASTIDILIPVSKGTTGSLMRLLTSLYTADYAGSAPPKLTIDLHQDVDDVTRQYIRNYPWPPPSSPFASRASASSSGGLTLRHRISTDRLSPVEASIRFMESFYPANSDNHHVLVLTPTVQVSPLFFQYLKYNILEYHNSEAGRAASNLMGISLDLPQTHFNGSTGFEPPQDYVIMAWEKAAETDSPALDPPPFQWQLPNSNAALYFGGKWVELHSFLTQRLKTFHQSNANKADKAVPPKPKLVPSSSPAWMEYALELMRCRGYSMLYPSGGQVTDPASSPHPMREWVTVHNEQYAPPEEFLMPPASRPETDEDVGQPLPSSVYEEPFIPPTTSYVSTSSKKRPENLLPSSFAPLHDVLPIYHPPRSSLSSNEGPLDRNTAYNEVPPLTSLPFVSWDSQLITSVEALSQASLYAEQFRRDQGGCSAEASDLLRDRLAAGRVLRQEGDVKDLFCVD